MTLDPRKRKDELAQRNLWGELLTMRDEQRDRLKTAVKMISTDDLPQEINRQGLMRWFMHPKITDTVISTLTVYEQEIPPGSRSGRLRFQGGQIVLILEGRGHTLVDGVKHSWEAGDVVNLPLKRDGITIQHVNESDDKPARFLAAEPNWFECTGVDRGSGFEQLEDAPEYFRKK